MYEGARKHSFFALGYYYATREEEKKDCLLYTSDAADE